MLKLARNLSLRHVRAFENARAAVSVNSVPMVSSNSTISTTSCSSLNDQTLLCSVPQLQRSDRSGFRTSCIMKNVSKDLLTSRGSSEQFNNRIQHTSRCLQHTSAVGKQGFISRLLESAGFKSGKMRYQKAILKTAGYNLYMCLTRFIEYDDFIKTFNLPDTLNSWFRVHELHMWMCMVRLAQEGADGLFLRTCFVEAMWEDMGNRAKVLGDTSASSRRKSISLLHTQFKAALLAYDEGLICDDHALAGSLWRTFFEMECDDITKLETLVAYVRRQLAFLDTQDSGVLLTSGLMPFLELSRETEDQERSQSILRNVVEA